MRRAKLRFDDGSVVELTTKSRPESDAVRFVNLHRLDECHEVSNIHVEVSDGLAVFVSGEFDLADDQRQL